ncbi:MAG: prepilin-type N-terminal cleavage/methylation domain-containing protein [Candidatus Peribacteria bacterium]|nr:prepilin-type N-terminal cleavage/methylation domain-containing protein [Candidatus Peribacteria bacterium]
MQKKALYSYFNSEVIKAKKRAFTLIELIVVITILVIL